MTWESVFWVRRFTRQYCAVAFSPRQSGEALPDNKQTPKSICILRLSALGDVIHVVPIIRAFEDNYPDTQITWIIGKLEHRLLSGLKNVEFMEFDKRGGWSAIRELRGQLADRRFEVLFHMQVATRSNLLSKLIRAPIRIGWDNARSREMHQFFVNRQVAAVPFQHQALGFLEFPRALGMGVTQPRWDIPIESAAMQWADKLTAGYKRTLIISPCSSHKMRNWRAEYYAAVADFAQDQLGMQVILSGGPSKPELDMAAAIEGRVNRSCLNLVGKDTLEQLKALLNRADLVISPDSGPAHIASALGTPVIGLHAATWSKRSGPFNSLDLCVDHCEQAARKYRNLAPEHLRWGTRIEVPGVMDLIRVDDVIERMCFWKARLES